MRFLSSMVYNVGCWNNLSTFHIASCTSCKQNTIEQIFTFLTPSSEENFQMRVFTTEMKCNYIKTKMFVFQGTYHICDVISDTYTFKSEFILPDMTNISPLSMNCQCHLLNRFVSILRVSFVHCCLVACSACFACKWLDAHWLSCH